ncbi:hypothetical protein ABZT06_38905 [Streptomyces sp. NPDC005483]|uniref:hypothetical protein n=1 Tax=Streptomyces sp. NPDC005483 TaxID=3154882 RepID=UPI0033BB8592
MSTSSFPSFRRVARTASTLIVVALPAVLLALVIQAGVPESWWPQTGQAFASEQPHVAAARTDPCTLIAGPAQEYCERGHQATASSLADEDARKGASAAWMLLPPAAGLVAVVMWLRRGAAGHGRP